MQSGRNLKAVHSGTVHVVTDAQESQSGRSMSFELTPRY